MARQERPVDPAAGPLQSFASDLRKVRTEAGNPTYRALARVAGYSATTLSEAAAGTRLPTLNVVLAYVGACGGNVAAWRERWHRLDAELAAGGQAPGAAAEVPPEAAVERDPDAGGAAAAPDRGADAPPAVPAVPGDVPARGPWRSQRRLIAAGAVAAVALASVFVLWLHLPDRRTASAPSCPKTVGHPAFTGVAHAGGVRVHDGADLDAPTLFTIPGNCTVGFTGYCLGQKVHDSTGGTPDIRWFKLDDDRVVASAVIHGNPPPGLAPTRCQDDRAGPDGIALSVTGAAAGLTLVAQGRNVDIVGFTVSYPSAPDRPDPRRWHQVGLTEATGSQFRTVLKVGQLDDTVAGPVVIVAAACLGGDGPTPVVDVTAVRLGDPPVPLQRPALTAAELTSATGSACRYPSRS